MHLPYKRLGSYLPVFGVGLVSVWSLYLGVMIVFKSTQGDRASTGEMRLVRNYRGGGVCDGMSSTRSVQDEVDVSRNDGEKATERSSERVAGQAGQPQPLGKLAMAKPDGQNKVFVEKGAATCPHHVSHSNPAKRAGDERGVLRNMIIDKAVALALKSKEPWKNLIVVSMEQYRRGEKEEARSILLMAEKMAVDPDDVLASSAAVGEVVKAMLVQRQTDDAMEALQNVQNTRERERALAEVAAWSARFGKVDMARNLIVQITNHTDRDAALVAIAESEASYEGLSTAMQTVTGIVNERRKDDAYRRIALKRGDFNDFTGANQAVLMIRDDRLRDSAQASLAHQRACSGDVDGGLLSLQNVTNPALEDSSLRKLTEEMARLGRFSTSAYVATRIRDDRERSYALERLSIEQARAGDLSGSLARTDSIPMDSVRERTLRSVSRVTADKGSPEQARNVAIRISSGRERDRAYRGIAQAAAADGDHVTAYNTLQEIDHPDEKALALVSMARTRQRQGDERQALSMLEDASRTASTLKSTQMADRIQSNMAVAYAERSESVRSLVLADGIRDLRSRDRTYQSLTSTLAGRDIQAAQRSALSIFSEQVRISAEDIVARTLARKVQPKDAISRARTLNPGRQQIVFLLEVSRKI